MKNALAVTEPEALDSFASLAEKQQRLIEAYVDGGCTSKTEAYRSAYGEHTSYLRQAAWREFSKAKVKAALAEFRMQLASESVATREELAARLTKIALGRESDATVKDQVQASSVLIRMLGFDEGHLQENKTDVRVQIAIPVFGSGAYPVDVQQYNELARDSGKKEEFE